MNAVICGVAERPASYAESLRAARQSGQQSLQVHRVEGCMKCTLHSLHNMHCMAYREGCVERELQVCCHGVGPTVSTWEACLVQWSCALRNVTPQPSITLHPSDVACKKVIAFKLVHIHKSRHLAIVATKAISIW